MTPLEIPGLRRISLDGYFAGERPAHGERYWVDQCLYDIGRTVEMAVRSAARAGARAVCLYCRTTMLMGEGMSYRGVLDACVEHDLTIVVCFDDFHREIFREGRECRT